MAVAQVVFKHRRPTCCKAEEPAQAFSHQLRRLVIPEANVWENEQDVLLEWGDPAHALDVARLRGQLQQGRPESVFGRSWIHYQRTTQTVTLAVDRLGLFPILLAQRQGASYLASDGLALAQVLGYAAQPSAESLLELLAYGQLLGNRSTLEDVQHLPAGSIVTLGPQGTFHLHHAWPLALQTHGSGEQECLDALIAAVDKRLRTDPETLLLLDSTPEAVLLLAAAQAGGHRPDVLSCGMPEEQAERLADVVGVKLFSGDALKLNPSLGEASAQLSAGEVPLHRPHLLMCPDLVARTRGATLLTSTGAGAFRGAYYSGGMAGFELLSFSGLKTTLLKKARQHIQRTLAHTLRPVCEAFPALAEMLQERLAQRLDVYQPRASDAAHYLDTVYLGEYVRRREVAEQQLLARDYARSHPFLDAEVMAALAGLPAYWRAGGRFYRHALVRLNPDLARLSAAPAPRQHLLPMPTAHDRQIVSPLRDTLFACALPENEIQRGIRKLLYSPARTHTLGVLGAYNAWLQHIRQHTLLACAGSVPLTTHH